MDTPRAAPVLVDDLIPIILESEDHWWPRDFQRLALVSPAWVSPVRKRLYAQPSLRSYRACGLLARTFTENPDLLSYVQRLELCPTADEVGALDEREMQSLRCILGLKGLKSVTLGGDLAVAAHRFLTVMVDTRTVTELHIDGCMLTGGRSDPLASAVPSLEWDDAIAFRFPNLRSLTLSNLLLTVIPSMMDRPAGLTHLTLNNVDVEAGSLPDICQGSWDTLRDLRIIRGTTVKMRDDIRSMLEMCESIETLLLDAYDLLYHPCIFDEDEPPLCPSLRKLCISGFDASAHTLRAIAQACPQLQDLAVLGRIVRISLDEWASFVSSRTSSSLQRLIVPAGTHRPPFTFWSSDEQVGLLKVCDGQAVTLANLTCQNSPLADW
ncbi:hypothetical protein BV20DRAFT_936053 [Pilatotrama ljubarskyi]|nr:hypothetical protein BV20DRAFT_936053 [Pilatotrama ljubarskyi]